LERNPLLMHAARRVGGLAARMVGEGNCRFAPNRWKSKLASAFLLLLQAARLAPVAPPLLV